MQPAVRTSFGYGLVGLLIGLVLFPWFYLWSVRSKTAVVQDPTWMWMYVAIFLVPTVVLALVGYSRARSPGPPA